MAHILSYARWADIRHVKKADEQQHEYSHWKVTSFISGVSWCWEDKISYGWIYPYWRSVLSVSIRATKESKNSDCKKNTYHHYPGDFIMEQVRQLQMYAYLEKNKDWDFIYDVYHYGAYIWRVLIGDHNVYLLSSTRLIQKWNAKMGEWKMWHKSARGGKCQKSEFFVSRIFSNHCYTCDWSPTRLDLLMCTKILPLSKLTTYFLLNWTIPCITQKYR